MLAPLLQVVMLPAARGRDDHTENLLNQRRRADTAFAR
jgi:hypothetical protein